MNEEMWADYYATLDQWMEIQASIGVMQEKERALRKALVDGMFPDPKEGVNKSVLPDGRTFKATHKINRYVDQKAVTGLPAALRKKVMKTKFDLMVGPYRQLTDEELTQVDNVLTIKPGLPSLEILEPKPK